MKPTAITNHNVYERYGLSKNGKVKSIGKHRLMALAFLPNPKNLPFVDHIDRDKSNNCLSNLRWVNKSQNCVNKKINGKLGYRHISELHCKKSKNSYYQIGIVRNQKFIFNKCFPIKEYTLEEVVKYRNEVVYPQLNIEIDD